MRIALSADWQFDSYARFGGQHASGATVRLWQMLEAWRWVCADAKKRKCDVLAVVGDLYDSREAIDLPVIDLVCRALHEAHDDFEEIWLLPGNHDSYLRHPGINSLQMFRGYAEVIEQAEVRGVCGLVPWTEDITRFREGVGQVADAGAKFLLSHVLVSGAVPHGKGIPVEYLQAERFRAVFLGDVHDPVEVAPNAFYIGSPLQLDYRDAGRKRGYVVLDTSANYGPLPIIKATRIENEVSPRFHVLGDDATLPGVKKAVRTGDFVRVTASDPEQAADLAVVAGECTAWVESKTAAVVAAPPRLDVHAKDPVEDVLAKYVAHRCPDASDARRQALVVIGIEIIEEAKP